MKTCSKCHLEKPETDYHRKSETKRDSYCKDCRKVYQKEHYNKNKSKRIKQIRDSQEKCKLELFQYIIDYLSHHPCVDCNENDPIVLDFDHQRDKSFTIGKWYSRRKNLTPNSLKMIESEIAKCEVRCANCHRRKTAKEQNHNRFKLLKSSRPGSNG